MPMIIGRPLHRIQHLCQRLGIGQPVIGADDNQGGFGQTTVVEKLLAAAEGDRIVGWGVQDGGGRLRLRPCRSSGLP